MSRIFLYPPLRNAAGLDNIFCRLALYFNPNLSKITASHFTSRRALVHEAKLASQLDSLVVGALKAVKAKIKLLDHCAFPDANGQVDPARDMLLIWDEIAEKDAPGQDKTAIKVLNSKQGLYRVDPLRTRMEGSFYLWARLNHYADRTALVARNYARMHQMVAEIAQHKKAYFFGSGQTLSDFVEGHDFKESIGCVAN